MLLYGLHVVISQSDHQVLKLSGFFTFLGLRFTPVILVSAILQKVPSGKLVASLQTMNMPKNIIITLAVAMRFLPIMKFEYETIQMSSQLRGLSLRQLKNWLHPLRSFEYTIIPLMMRTLKIADELAASAATKGIDYPKPRTSIYMIHITILDYIILLLFAAANIVVFMIIQ